MFSWHKKLVEKVSAFSSPLKCVMSIRCVFLERVGELSIAYHQLGVQKALDEPDAALLSKVRRKRVTYRIAQNLGGYLWRE